MTKFSEELEKTAKIAFFITFSQIPKCLTSELEFFRKGGFHTIVSEILLHDFKVYYISNID